MPNLQVHANVNEQGEENTLRASDIPLCLVGLTTRTSAKKKDRQLMNASACVVRQVNHGHACASSCVRISSASCLARAHCATRSCWVSGVLVRACVCVRVEVSVCKRAGGYAVLLVTASRYCRRGRASGWQMACGYTRELQLNDPSPLACLPAPVIACIRCASGANWCMWTRTRAQKHACCRVRWGTLPRRRRLSVFTAHEERCR